MKAAVALLCLGLALASEIPNDVDEYQPKQSPPSAYTKDQAYRYYYDSQALHGFPKANNQRSGQRIQAEVHLVKKAGEGHQNEKWALKLSQIFMGSSEHLDLDRDESRILRRSVWKKAELSDQDKQQLEQTIEFERKNGEVKQITHNQNEQEWTVNIKRAIVSLFSHRLTTDHPNQEQAWCPKGEQCAAQARSRGQAANFLSFQRHEPSNEGTCMTTYAISSNPNMPPGSEESVVNATKTIDLQRCNEQGRPQISYNAHLNDQYDQNERRYINATSTVSINAVGTRQGFVIERVQSISQYIVPDLSDDQQAIYKTVVNQSLQFIEETQAQPSEYQVPAPQEKVSLTHSFKWDKTKEQYFVDSASTEFRQNAKNPFNKIAPEPKKIALELLKDLARYMVQVPLNQHAPTTFQRLVRVIRLLNEAELKELHNDVFEKPKPVFGENKEQIKAAKDIIHIAMGAAGTAKTFDHLVTVLDTVAEKDAIAAIRQLQNARVVGQTFIEEVLKKCQNFNEKPALQQACLLTYGSMARTWCMGRGNKWASYIHKDSTVQECKQQQRQQIVQELKNMFPQSEDEDSQEWIKQVSVVKALGNAGLPESLPKLVEIIRNHKIAELVRIEAAKAMRHLRVSVPRQAIIESLAIVQDRDMEPAIRMVCADIVIRSRPTLGEMQQLAAQVNRKQDNRAVKSFIYTYLSDLANSTYTPNMQQQSEQARIVLGQIKDEEKVIRGSFARSSPLYSSERRSRFGYNTQIQSIMSNMSALPTMLSLKAGFGSMGSISEDMFSLSLSTEAVDKAIMTLISGSQQSQTRGRRSASEDIRKQLQDLTANFETVNPEQAKLLASLRIMGQDVGFLPLDFESLRALKQWVVDGKPLAEATANKEVLRKILQYVQTHAQGQQVNYNFATMLAESSYKIPTAMGLPLSIRTATPLLAQFRGKIGAWKQGEYLVKDMELKPSVMSKTDITVEMWSPVEGSGAKIEESLRLAAGISGSIKKTGQLEINMPSEKKQLLSMDQQPSLFTRRWYEHTDEDNKNEYVKPQIVPVANPRYAVRESRTNVMGMQVTLKSRLQNQHQSEWSMPYMIYPVYGPNHVHVTVNKASQGSCNTLKAKMSLPTFNWLSNIEDVQIKEFSGPEHQLRQANGPFYQAKMRAEVECAAKKEVHVEYTRSADNRMRRFDAQLKSGAQKGCIKAEVLYPPSAQSPNKIFEEDGKKSRTYSQFIYSWNDEKCQSSDSSDKRIQIAVQSQPSAMKRQQITKAQVKYDECKNAQDSSSVMCYDIIKQAARPNQHIIQAKYDAQMPLYYKNVTQKAVQMLLNSHAQKSEINKYEKSNANEINAEIVIDPKTTSRANITVQEPGQTFRLKDIKSSFLDWESSTVKQLLNPMSYNAQCKVSNSHIQTFDQNTIRAPVTDCWSVLAKDCKRNKFAVMLRQATLNSEQKVLRVVTPSQDVEIKDNLQVQVNGQAKNIAGIQVHKIADDFLVQRYERKVKITLPKEGVVVYFDGKNAVVEVNAMYFSEQCGLCGHYSRDAQDVLRSPAGEQQSNVLEWFKQYQIESDPACTKGFAPEQYSYQAESWSFQEQREQQPMQGRIGRKWAGVYCVSTSDKNKCPHGYHGVERQTQEVEVRCAQHQLASHDLHNAVRNNRQIDFGQFDVDSQITITMEVPTKCVRA